MRVPLTFFGDSDAGPAWDGRYRLEWSQVVGGRVKRLRLASGKTIREVAGDVQRADRRPYSASTISRLERGWASPPLFVYLRLADLFEVAPGALLGTEGFGRAVDDAELTLVRVSRRLGLTPEEAITRLVAGD